MSNEVTNPGRVYGAIFEEHVGTLAQFSIDDFVPMPGRVLVAEAPPNTKFGRGILLMPEKHMERKCIGVVLAVSDEETRLEKEDVVVYLPNSGDLFPMSSTDGEEVSRDLVLLTYTGDPADDIVGRLKPRMAPNEEKMFLGVDKAASSPTE